MDNHIPYFNGLKNYFYKDINPDQRLINKIYFFKELAISLRKMKTKNNKITDIFREAYRASIKYTDKHIGEIVYFLKNKYPNTVFIIASDHGESFMEHGLLGHEAYSLYNELIQIPLLINTPSSKHKIISQTISLVSIAKTIAAIAKVKVSQFQGDNILANNIFSPINNLSRILYKCKSPHVRMGILDNRTEITGYPELWSFTTPKEKYVLGDNGKVEEYYSLVDDPQEKENLIKNKSGLDVRIVNELKKAIKRYNNEEEIR